MTETVGLVGLGAMGLPIGKRILESGRGLVVVPHTNRTPAEELKALGARIAAVPADLALDCSTVLTSLPDVPHVEEVLFGQYGLASQDCVGLLYIDLSTITPSATIEFERKLAAHGIQMLDAPVSGGPMRAAEGTLTIMVGGSQEAYDRARSLLEVFGKNIVHVGGSGTGQVVKLTNQLLISVIMVANAEALSLGVKAGVPLETLLEVIGTSSGSNYLLQNWLPRTLFSGDLDHGFALDLLMKDLNAVLQMAAEAGSPVFGGALAQQLYRSIRATGEEVGRLDYSVVARIFEEVNGVDLRLPEK